MRRRGSGSAGSAPAPGRVTGRHEVRGTPRGRWMTLGKDGRLTVYALTDGGLLRWTQRAPGGDAWQGPDVVEIAGLTDLTVVQGADTYVHFLGRRERGGGDDGPGVDFVHAIQYQTGRPVTEWRSLGNVYADRRKGRLVGRPAGVVTPQGVVFVFVRNAGGGLQMRREGKGGKWSGWTDLKGAGLSADLVASTTSGGLVEVFAPGERGVQQWRQNEPEGPPVIAPPVQFHALEGSVTALETAPERLTYYWTDVNRSGVVCYRPGTWPVPVGGQPGVGAVVALRAPLDGYDCTVLAQRGAGGTLLIGVCGTEAEQDGVWWSDTAAPCAGDPALALDGRGRVVVAICGRDGSVAVARQEPGPGLTLSPHWQRL